MDHTYAGREVPELFPVYISNVFNISDDKVGDSYYTPYACLKGIVYNEKQQYGQGWNSYLHNNISAYSEYMVNDVLRYYSNFQGGLYIKCYEHIPESVRNDLHIFEKYVVGVHQFGNFYKDLSQKVDEKLDKEIKMIKQKFSADQIREFEFFRQCYLTLLCETYLFFGKTKTEDEEIKESTIGIKIDEYLKNRKLDIDINLLKDISCEIKAMQNGAFENLDWFKQFEASIPVFKEYKGKDFKVGYKRFGESDDILKFYMDECIKNYSIFKRYMIFHPWFISSGEEALTNIFAYLCEAMLKIKGKNIILVIDEIDAYLHPTWQQSILKSLTDGLQEFYPDRTFQIVFTTHSPIVLSDLTGDRVLCLEKKDKEIVVTKYKNKCFGANVQRLFYDGFFMDKGSIGEMAKDKIESVLNYIEMHEPGNEETVQKIIDNIGETVVRKQLQMKFDRIMKGKNNNNNYELLREQIEKVGVDKAIDILSKYTKE